MKETFETFLLEVTDWDSQITFLQLSSGCLKLLRCNTFAKFKKKYWIAKKLRMNKSASG